MPSTSPQRGAAANKREEKAPVASVGTSMSTWRHAQEEDEAVAAERMEACRRGGGGHRGGAHGGVLVKLGVRRLARRGRRRQAHGGVHDEESTAGV